MSELNCTEYDFLNNIAFKLESGENLERAFFLTENVPEEILLRLQLGEELTSVIKSISFRYPSLANLFSSVNQAEESDVLERLKTTSRLIRIREEIIEEKESTLKVQRRRIKIIRYITLIIIAIIAGFSPIFSNLYEFINTGEFTTSLSIFSYLSISFLLINLLNNYYLLKLSNENHIKIRLLIVLILHSIILIGVRYFLIGVIPI
ncbi:hypothetical protein EU534_02670 [Candidatus Heimdallarchaeota archaeon]|nr:MAG: hypothetical protein EU534_02670 [Candidatus Heimdallarchaeota archaeon]